ncbi:MAG TPA: MlaD family protein [Novimethylophilus sp.]|jgi:phospholipid/cholesterol/gamma-HCH transport system substrate-binding protein|uniref:MlaD family protein n=1 Tax=Novimethylophilus sp. TaxID=2137426 RepID=UPI002F3EA692
MENRAYAFIAGLFALLLCAALVVAFWWLGGSHKAETEYEIVSAYPVIGLNPQAAVRYRGVDVGSVREIALDPAGANAIVIRVAIDSRMRLTRSSFAKLVSQGLTGLSYIELDDSGLDKTPLGTGRIPLRESDMSQLINSGKEILGRTAHLLDTTERLLKTFNRLLDDNNTQKIERLISNMERSSRELAPLLRSSHITADKAGRLLDGIHPRELSDTLEAIRKASASMQETSDAARPALIKFRQSLDEFERIGRHIEQASAELGDTINNETLPQAHELTQQLHQDAESLNRLMETLEQNPQSMIFGKPQPLPGPGEKGFRP